MAVQYLLNLTVFMMGDTDGYFSVVVVCISIFQPCEGYAIEMKILGQYQIHFSMFLWLRYALYSK